MRPSVELCGRLYGGAKGLVTAIWRRYFLLYLTEGVLRRPFCRKEIRWCARRLDALA
jgi:hypothetical protein